jgi:O-antigen/teichoic acid export membrane protein
MNFHYRQLLKGTTLLSVSGVLRKGVGFFLLPVYTAYLTPEDYGAVELFLVFVGILSIVVAQGLTSALMKRIAYDHGEDDRQATKIAFGTALIFVVGSALLVGAIAVVFSKQFAGVIFDSREFGYLIMVGAANVLFQTSYDLMLVPLRADQKYGIITISSFAVFLGALGGNLVFLIVFKAGFSSLVYGRFLGSVMGASLAYFFARPYLEWKFDRKELRILTKFGRPLILSAIGFMALSSTDRILLKYFGNSADVGLYSIAAQFGLAVSTVLLGPFTRTWPTVYYRIARQADAKEHFSGFATGFLAFGLLSALGFHFFAPYMLVVMTRPAFYAAGSAIGLLVLGRFLFALNDILKVGMNIEKKTHLLPIRVVFAGILNVVIDILLIPRLGIVGAALGTVISFAAMDVYTIWACRGFYRVAYNWAAMAGLIVMAALALLAQIAVSGQGTAADIAIKSVILLVFGAIAWRGIGPDVKRQLFSTSATQ